MGLEEIGGAESLRARTARGRPWGLLRVPDRREPVSLEAFLEHGKAALGVAPACGYVSRRHVRCAGWRWAAAPAATGFAEALDAGCDTFVTADVKYNQFWDARDLGMNLIDAGHFWTENPGVRYPGGEAPGAISPNSRESTPNITQTA